MQDNFDAARDFLDTCGLELPSDTYDCLNNSWKFNDGVLGLITQYTNSGYTFELGLKALLMAPAFNDAKISCEQALNRYK